MQHNHRVGQNVTQGLSLDHVTGMVVCGRNGSTRGHPHLSGVRRKNARNGAANFGRSPSAGGAAN
eukprot:3327568-Lingulodinium_polyedra.AAC.1